MKIRVTFDVDYRPAAQVSMSIQAPPMATTEIAAEVTTIGDRAAFIDLAMGSIRRRLAEILSGRGRTVMCRGCRTTDCPNEPIPGDGGYCATCIMNEVRPA